MCLVNEYLDDLSSQPDLRLKTTEGLKASGLWHKVVTSFDTSVLKIEDYLMHLCILVKSKYMKPFLQNINIPYDYDEMEKLKQLRHIMFRPSTCDAPCIITPAAVVQVHTY